MGGLGNQMFQYAAAKNLAFLHKTDLLLDVSFLHEKNHGENFTNRDFELDCFNLDAKHASADEIIGYIKKANSKGLFRLIGSGIHTFTENQFNFHQDFFQLPKNCLLEGYFQTEKYFISNEKIIRRDFSFKSGPLHDVKMVLNHIENSESVSIHVRRGDFISNAYTNRFHGSCTIEYYQEAVNVISSKLTSPFFYVFSDDINWCKTHFKSIPNFVFVDGNFAGHDDLRLMSNCKHHIIANSSFSWWGAWLGKNEEQIVIAPKQWFNPEAQLYGKLIDTSDLYPKGWLKL